MSKSMKVVFAVLAFATLAGCKPDPISETHQGTIEASDPKLDTDQSNYDEYSFKAAEGMQITLTLSSAAFDAYVHLIDKDGNQLAHSNDGADGNNARVTFTAPYTGDYKAYANTASSGMTGAYTLNIVTAAAGAAPAAPAAH